MITLNGVAAGYEKLSVLSDIHAVLPQGALTGIIGPNGSGKSTLLKTICGLLPAINGEIQIDGENIHALSRRKRAQLMAFLPQMRITPDLTVEELVSHGRYPYLGAKRSLSAADWKCVDLALERTQTLPFRDHLLSRLSGGERQRAYLAMLLAQDAPHMLLDEPTTYLDPASQFELMALLRNLAEENRAVAVVLHDLPLALHYCHQLIVLDQGRITAQGTPEELILSGALEAVFHVHLHQTNDGFYAISK